MAYTKTVWKDRKVQSPSKFRITTNSDGTIELASVPGVVTEEGTQLSADTFNNMEQGIKNNDTHIGDMSQITEGDLVSAVKNDRSQLADIMYNLTTAGADNTETNDCSPLINANIDKKRMALKEGSYKLLSKIKTKDNFHLTGAGIDKTFLKSYVNDNLFSNDDSSSSYETIVLENLTIDCAGAIAPLDAINLLKYSNVKLINVKIINCLKEGFVIQDSDKVLLINTHAELCKYGYSLLNTKNLVAINCKAINNSWDGFLTNSLTDSMFINCYAEHNGYNCGEGNTACGFYNSMNGDNIKFIGCKTKDNNGRTLELDTVTNCKVIGHEANGDLNGFKVIGNANGTGDGGGNIFNDFNLNVKSIALITYNTKGNKFNNGFCNSTASPDTSIFDDGSSGSDYNEFKNIKCSGYVTAPINSGATNSTYDNIYDKNNNKYYKILDRTLYIDNVNGLDTNNGKTSALPVKTFSQIKTLIGKMEGQTLTIKVLGTSLGISITDWQTLTKIQGQGSIIFDFEGRTIVSIGSPIAISDVAFKSNIIYTFKNITFSLSTSGAFYNYGAKVLLNQVVIASNLTIECLSGGIIICSNSTNITPAMKHDNGSSIMKDRWDATATIHVSLVDYSPV